MLHDLIIIGCGPAGMTAAVYARRAGLEVLMLEAGAPGGKVNLTHEIENWPGDETVPGPLLASRMFEHATNLGAVYEYGDVSEIRDCGDYKEVDCNGTVYQAKAVLIASGTKERLMNVKNEVEMTGHGVSYCAVCDGPFFRNEVVVVIGGGNSALQEAHYLASICKEVHLLVRRDVFRADKAVADKVLSKENIIVHWLRKPVEVLEQNGKVSGILIEDSNTHETEVIECQGIFPFVGMDPVSGFAKGLGILDQQGYVLTDETMATSVKGIYAAGDVRKKVLRQVVTAANDGAIAAQEIAHLLGH